MTNFSSSQRSEHTLLSTQEEENLIEATATFVAQKLADEKTRREISGEPAQSAQTVDHSRAVLIAEQMRVIRSELLAAGKVLSSAQATKIRDNVESQLNGLGILQSLLENDQTTDVLVNGFDQVFIKRVDGTKKKIEGTMIGSSDADLIRLINSEAQKHGKKWNESEPTVGLALRSKTGRIDRLSGVAFVTTRPSVTIRRPNYSIICLQDLVELNALNESVANLLRALVLAKKNILVSGGTGAGKTVLLRCLINEIPPDERLISIEDPIELGLQYFIDLHPDQIEGFTRRADAAGKGEYTIRTFLKEAGLRQSPDRVLVGEIRGAEAVEMYSAMTQGNAGSMCTIHADSSELALQRLQMYLLMAPEHYSPSAVTRMGAQAVDYVVHVEHLPEGRVVSQIRQVTKGTSENIIESDLLYSYKKQFFKPPAAVGMNPLTLEDLEKGEAAANDTFRRIEASGLRNNQMT